MRRTLQKELESRGSIFTGRDEKSILIRKRQEERQKMKEDLERQIEEKKRQKEEEKQRELHFEKLEEERIKREITELG